MIDLYQLLEKQEYSEIELSDGTRLVVRYRITNNTDRLHSAAWEHAPGANIPEWALTLYEGKTARIAITAALQARYPE